MEQTGEENGTNGGKRVQKKELLRGGNCVWMSFLLCDTPGGDT